MDVLPTLARKSADYMSAQAKTGKPYFLYLPLTSPHTPILPSKQWQGKSSIGKYGDFVMETDWAVGEVLAALEKAGISRNTLVIFTSDNGCAKAAKITEMEAKGHFPSADLRASKSDIFDGGHRIPFLVRWPERIKAGSRSDQTQRLKTAAALLLALLLPLGVSRAAETNVLKPDRVVTYKTVGEVTLKLHVFEPAGLKTNNQRPAIVFFFGGGWAGGDATQ